MKIVVLEDDADQSEWLLEQLKLEFPKVEIELKKSELAFSEAIENFKQSPPDLFILDVMVRWTTPSKDQVPPPADVERDHYYRAGIRCLKRLYDAGINTPTILYTILEKDDFSQEWSTVQETEEYKEIVYIRKDTDLGSLVAHVRRLLQRQC